MAKSLQRTDLQEYVAAWAAHFCFTDGQYEKMVQWLEASHLDQAQLPEAAGRASLVAAVAWQTCGEDKTATKWFGRARDIARSIGDRATIMASIANRAAIRLNAVWLDHFMERDHGVDILNLRSELLGALGYESTTGTVSLLPQAFIFRMRLAYLQLDTELARRNFELAVKAVRLDTYSILSSTLIFGMWLAHLDGLGVRKEALDSLSVLEADISVMDSDDSAVSWKILSNIAIAYGELELGSSLLARSFASANENETERQNLHLELSKCIQCSR
jgi:hypothetical protein